VSRDIFNWIRLLRAPSNLAWNVSKDGTSPTSLGNLYQPVPGSVDYFTLTDVAFSSFHVYVLKLRRVNHVGVGVVWERA